MKTIPVPVEDELDQALETLSFREGRAKPDLVSDIVRSYIIGRQRRERAAALDAFLIRTVEEGLIAGETASSARTLLADLSGAAAGSLMVPDAAPGPDGQVLLAWDDREHHLEVELFADGRVEFFHRNRKTGALWGVDSRLGQPIPAEVVTHLQRFRLEPYA